jgi:hypothetical protein
MLNLNSTINVPIIKGEGFILRPYQTADALSLQRNINDKRIARDVSNIPYPSGLGLKSIEEASAIWF